MNPGVWVDLDSIISICSSCRSQLEVATPSVDAATPSVDAGSALASHRADLLQKLKQRIADTDITIVEAARRSLC